MIFLAGPLVYCCPVGSRVVFWKYIKKIYLKIIAFLMTKMCTNCVNTTLLSMMSYCQSGSLVYAPVQTGVVLVAAPRVLLPTTWLSDVGQIGSLFFSSWTHQAKEGFSKHNYSYICYFKKIDNCLFLKGIRVPGGQKKIMQKGDDTKIILYKQTVTS